MSISLDALQDLSLTDPNVRVQDGDFLDIVDVDASEAFSFSEREELILGINDQLEEMRLEITPDISSQVDLEELLRTATKEAAEAKASYTIKSRIEAKILLTDPSLKAVHSGQRATPAERTLLPLINQRDLLSMVHTNIASALSSTVSALSTAEMENLIASARNAELTSTLIHLAEITKLQEQGDLKDPKVKAQFVSLQEEKKIARSRWRIMKSVVAAVIVGSGIDWSQDEVLQELVIDREEGMI
ncbi:MAG: hypothetical protein M1827_002764 [Pycnora praestabilis]|nr:MAG: hypothetical protein M1827_002764 [Pycnora praestabilis]